MTSHGFSFHYRLTGTAPSIRRFLRSEAPGIAPGDLVALASGAAVLATSGDATLLGVALAARVGAESYLEVISDEDAVYGVQDPVARVAGDSLDLAGGTGTQGVEDGPNEDFEVVVNSTATEATLLRIRLGKHAEFSVPLSYRAGAPEPLAPTRERELVLAAAAGDEKACATLVETFLPAVAGVARQYRAAIGVQRSELMQEGVVGLLRAIKRFDPAVGAPFWAYASWWVRQAMQQLVSEVARPMVLSDRAQRALARVRNVRRTHIQEHGREPTIDELAAASGLDREQVERILAAERASRALSEPLDFDDATGGTLGEQIADPTSEDGYQQIIDQLVTEQLRSLTDALDDRERAILYDHYGVGRAPQTFREIGKRLGLSPEGVRQIEGRALEKLRAAAVS